MATETKPKVVIEVYGQDDRWWLRMKALNRWWGPQWPGDRRWKSDAAANEVAASIAAIAEAQGFDVEVQDA